MRSSRSLVVLGAVVLAVCMSVALSGCLTINTPAKPATPEPAPAPAPAVEPAATGIKTGDTVAAPWGGAPYLGKVTGVTGETADVLYADDQVTRPVPVGELTLITQRTWSVGDKVMAVWTTGKFYAGTITEAKAGDVYTVKWDDGSSPSDVAAMKIYPQ
jgi:hypothetical protein